MHTKLCHYLLELKSSPPCLLPPMVSKRQEPVFPDSYSHVVVQTLPHFIWDCVYPNIQLFLDHQENKLFFLNKVSELHLSSFLHLSESVRFWFQGSIEIKAWKRNPYDLLGITGQLSFYLLHLSRVRWAFLSNGWIRSETFYIVLRKPWTFWDPACFPELSFSLQEKNLFLLNI